MKKQDYKNHIRYYLPHHLFFYTCVAALLAIGVRGLLRHHGSSWVWISINALSFMLGWLSFMLRQHYALTCQNRIVRLELRFRYFVLTGKRLEPVEAQLSFGQLAALRFASDAEFDALLQRAIQEQLTPDDIKKAIVHWKPDYMRV